MSSSFCSCFWVRALVGLLLRLFTASYSCFPSGGVSVLLLYVCSLHLLGVFSSSCSIAGGSLSSGIASSIAPDPSRVLGTGLEVFPTPASARCSSYCLNSCKQRRPTGSSGWALSGTIPTQAQSAPSSGAAFFRLLSPPRVLGTGLVDYLTPASAKGSRYRRQNPCEDYRPPTSAVGAGRRQYPCNEGRSAENPGWSLFGSTMGRTPRRASAARAPRFIFRK